MCYAYCIQNEDNPGCAAEYKKRHDEIWPDLKKLLTEAGILTTELSR